MAKQDYLNEDGEFWRKLKEDYKNRRDKRNERNQDTVQAICIRHGIEFKEFNTNSFMLIKNCKRVAYYPPSGKYHNLQTNKWSKVQNHEKLENKIVQDLGIKNNGE